MRTSVVHKEMRKYTFPMTDQDVIARVDQCNEQTSIQDNLNAKKKLIDNEIKHIKADIQHKMNCIARREEPREVEVNIIMDYKNMKVEEAYQGEIKHSRPMTKWEFEERPDDVLPPEPEEEKVEVTGEDPDKTPLEEAIERAEEIGEKQDAMQTPSANVNAFSEAKTEKAVGGLNV